MQKIINITNEWADLPDKLDEDCYLLNSGLKEDFYIKFMKLANLFDKIVLFYGDEAISLAIKYKADGVVLDLGFDNLRDKMAELRKKLGKNKFIGLFTRNRRHETMLVAEVEPDFVIFKVWAEGIEKVQEVVNWYDEFFLIRSAIWPMEKVNLEGFRADFLIEVPHNI